VQSLDDVAGGYVIQWTSRSNRYYDITWRTNLVMEPVGLVSNLVYPQSSYTDAMHSVETLIYYRVGVSR